MFLLLFLKMLFGKKCLYKLLLELLRMTIKRFTSIVTVTNFLVSLIFCSKWFYHILNDNCVSILSNVFILKFSIWISIAFYVFKFSSILYCAMLPCVKQNVWNFPKISYFLGFMRAHSSYISRNYFRWDRTLKR